MTIQSADLEVLATRRSQYPDKNEPEFLLVGRSNVGKSSFINTLLNRKNLAHTSGRPGKTQTLNFYKVNDEYIKLFPHDYFPREWYKIRKEIYDFAHKGLDYYYIKKKNPKFRWYLGFFYWI